MPVMKIISIGSDIHIYVYYILNFVDQLHVACGGSCLLWEGF